MTSNSHPTDSALVNALIDAISRFRVRIEALPDDADLEEESLREVMLHLGDRSFRCLADNEYGDMDRDNLPLQLNMILMELEHYDGVDDYLVWARGHGLDAASPKVDALWDRLQENAVAIRKIVGQDLVAMSSWDWSLYAGDARILRDLPEPLARPDLAAC